MELHLLRRRLAAEHAQAPELGLEAHEAHEARGILRRRAEAILELLRELVHHRLVHRAREALVECKAHAHVRDVVVWEERGHVEGELRVHLGYQRWVAGDLEGARTLYRAAAALRPDKALALAMLASFELDLGRCVEARQLASLARESASAEPPPHDVEAARRVLDEVWGELDACAPPGAPAHSLSRP